MIWSFLNSLMNCFHLKQRLLQPGLVLALLLLFFMRAQEGQQRVCNPSTSGRHYSSRLEPGGYLSVFREEGIAF